jgi:hypothetical protein
MKAGQAFPALGRLDPMRHLNRYQRKHRRLYEQRMQMIAAFYICSCLGFIIFSLWVVL